MVADARRARSRRTHLARGAPTGGAAPDGQRDDDRRPDEHDPRGRVARHERAGDQHDGDADRRRPVVADDEVVPEAQEPRDVRHGTTSPPIRLRAPRPRNAPTRPSANSATTAMTGRSDASPPGQCPPRPSVDQNTPKLVSMTPTTNFIEFSGTRVSGRCNHTPTPPTTTRARSAPADAVRTLPCAPPTVSTMNATSRPSRNTPLNARVAA